MRIETIIRVVCDVLKIEPKYIQWNTRQRDVCDARQVCHYFAKEFTKLSLYSIGVEIGEKDHATVIHSIKVVNNLQFANREFRKNINLIRTKLTDIATKGVLTNSQMLAKIDLEIMNTFAINDIY